MRTLFIDAMRSRAHLERRCHLACRANQAYVGELPRGCGRAVNIESKTIVRAVASPRPSDRVPHCLELLWEESHMTCL
ncbi:hypothetical protein OJAV_G00137320 [Oryzias javanicus]|uniref:Uncharacterized protein n=1 Tax=Oryzias javanicus TaxID=123683 RepID=A0A3S2MP34_ORYJA|nr:hypothetical protein OJAV_G00137320 [Oryzias javanicus]